MLSKVKQDTEEYELFCVPVVSFEIDEFYIDMEAKIPIQFENIIWIDFEAFDIIDSGEKYINPKHFSVSGLVGAL